MNINKRLKSMLVAVFMLLTFISVNAAPTSSQLPYVGLAQPSGGSNDKCYDGVCFEGEVEGNSLMTYENLIKELGITEGEKPSIPRNGYEEIYDKNAEEESKGGIWLKFTDSKYTRDGKPRTYYVMKKPARMGVSWNTLHTAGAVYGWDVIDPNTGLPKSNPEKYKNIGKYGNNADYKGKIITINGEKYIVRLLQGKTNYGGDVTNTKLWPDSGTINNSEWNRTILPITKAYRFGQETYNKKYTEEELLIADGTYWGFEWSKRSYKVQTANYNWFGDLTLSAYQDWDYNGKKYTGRGSNYAGQFNWTQEFGNNNYYRSFSGDINVSGGAAYSYNYSSNHTDVYRGVRLVLEPYNPPAPEVEVKQTIKLKKFDPDKKPLKGVKFILNGDAYTTDSKGEVEIPVWKYPAGNLILEEPEQTINGVKYTAKKIPIKREQSKCYDGMCFEGEIEGNSLITYQKMLDTFNAKSGQSKKLIENVPESTHKEIHDQYAQELSKGGIYLKFTDNKYKDSKGNPRTFYVSKKPITNGISYDMLYKAGMIYGQDLTPEEKSKIEKDSGSKTYTPTIVADSSGQKYIVRLLRSRSNYSEGIRYKTGKTDYKWQDAKNSEWNRSIVAITKQYRGESSSMEQSLKEGNSSTQWVTNNYKNQIAEYNWFGDLTLGTYSDSFKYNDKSFSGIKGKGQWNWTQEFNGDSHRSIRGYYSANGGAAYSNGNYPGNTYDYYGWRLVLEPLTTNN